MQEPLNNNGTVNNSNPKINQEDQFNQLDTEKLLLILKRSLPYALLIIATCVIAAYLVVRYTKDVYESSSVLQLDIKSEASVLGFKSFDDEINNLSKEIEFIKSKLFFNKVVDVVGLDVSYYAIGDVLDEEKYQHAPFNVDYQLKNSMFYDRRFKVDVLNSRKFKLIYKDVTNKVTEKTYQFGEKIDNDNFTFTITLTDNFSHENNNKYYYFTINSHEALVNYLYKNITVQPLDFKAKTITVSFRDNNKYKARDMVQAIDTLYLHYSIQEKNKANLQRIKFLNAQLESTEGKLSELENYFENFTIKNKTTNLDANLSKTISVLNALDSQTYVLKQKIDVLNGVNTKVTQNDELMLTPSEMSVLPGNSSQDFKQYESLLLEIKKLRNSYKPNTFALQKREEELSFIKDRIITQLEDYKKSLGERLDNIKDRRSNLEDEFVKLPSKRTEYSKTERYYNLYEEFYLSLMKNKAQFELAEAGTTTEYKILSPASLASKPVSPNIFLYFGIGALSGVFLSFMFIGVRYLTHNKISSQQELEALTSIPVLGSIPYFKKEKSETSRLLIDKHPKSILSEAFRAIRTNMEFIQARKDKPVICITSTISGEGKTFVAVNLGGIISLLENRVVIVDLDMRKPRLQKVFYDNVTTKGLSTILIGKHKIEECILQTSLKNLDYIPSGPIPPNPAELIVSDYFYKMLEALKNKYDVIIVDTPPVGLVTDGVLAMKYATTPLYVLRSEFSGKNFLKTALKLKSVHKLNNLSLILNSVKHSGGYGYGYGSGKYEYYEEIPDKEKITIKSILGK